MIWFSLASDYKIKRLASHQYGNIRPNKFLSNKGKPRNKQKGKNKNKIGLNKRKN
jgi:hypothetical protein